MPVEHNKHARLLMGIDCIIQYVTLPYPVDVQTSDFSVTCDSEWLIASLHCCIYNTSYSDDTLSTFQQQHASYQRVQINLVVRSLLL